MERLKLSLEKLLMKRLRYFLNILVTRLSILLACACFGRVTSAWNENPMNIYNTF